MLNRPNFKNKYFKVPYISYFIILIARVWKCQKKSQYFLQFCQVIDPFMHLSNYRTVECLICYKGLWCGMILWSFPSTSHSSFPSLLFDYPKNIYYLIFFIIMVLPPLQAFVTLTRKERKRFISRRQNIKEDSIRRRKEKEKKEKKLDNLKYFSIFD